MEERGTWQDIMAFIHLTKRELDRNCPDLCREHLSVSNAKFLAYLHKFRHKEIFQKDLEKAFSLRAATVSRSLKTLEERGYITRTVSDQDSRLKRIELTEKSLNIDSCIRLCTDNMFRKMTKDISDEDLAHFFTILEKMKENLSE